jgi:hypothetical protein
MDFSEAIYENAREHAKTTNIDWICGEVSNAKQDFSVALSVTSPRLGIQGIGVPIIEFETGCSFASNPPPSRLLVALLRVFLFHTLLRGRAHYMALHLCYLMTLLPSTNISILRVKEAWYREENFRDGFKVLWAKAYVATKSSTQSRWAA